MIRPILADECIGIILAYAGMASDKKLQTSFPKNVVGFANSTREQMFAPLTLSMRALFERLKQKTLEADGAPNSFLSWGEVVPTTLLSAWPRHHFDEYGHDVNQIILSPKFADIVAGEIEHTLVTYQEHGRELHIFLPSDSVPSIRDLVLVIEEGVYKEHDTVYDTHRRSVQISVTLEDGDGYRVDLRAQMEEYPSDFELAVSRVKDGRSYEERTKHPDRHRNEGVVIDVVRSLLGVQEGPPYLRLYSVGVLKSSIYKACRDLGVVAPL